ncbi:MAG: flagellar biosynthesis protein FlhB [Gammaproteobacteria bacterium]|nr:MAG: flagellar biosynthesis protein FlhB [Gammaproteobacteria bacterium]
MAQDDSQEKTEQPTPKKLNDARQKGQIARSRELNTLVVLVAGASGMIMLGEGIITDLAGIMSDALSLSRNEVFDSSMLTETFLGRAFEAIAAIRPFLVLMVVAALLAPVALGGWAFSVESLQPKLNRLDPIKGLGKVFGTRGVMELLKALAKFVLVLTVVLLYLNSHVMEFLALGTLPYERALVEMASLVVWGFLFASATLFAVALIDVPFQLWDHNRQMKMSRQEVKDEFKQTDGSPEVKSHVRRMQREMAQKRMMHEVPKADVVVTNPSHYAVALKYDHENMNAPVMVAKGADLVAGMIRKVAVANDVPIVSSPLLARAIFYNTELNEEIPDGLYLAVAQVLAYVFQLKSKRRYYRPDIIDMKDLPVPEELQHD